MGRRKYHMHGKQHGRNMLICEYIWIAWKQQTLPPGAPPPPQYTMQEVKPCQCKPPKKPHRDDEQCWVKVKHDWYRERKQVSSHIQVIKNFFRFHPACECSLPFFFCYYILHSWDSLVSLSTWSQCFWPVTSEMVTRTA